MCKELESGSYKKTNKNKTVNLFICTARDFAFSFGLFCLSAKTVSIFTWVQLSVRLLTSKLGNNYHEAAPWQQTIMSLTCSSTAGPDCVLFMQLQCPKCPQGAFWPLTLSRCTTTLLDLAVWLHSMRWVIDRDPKSSKCDAKSFKCKSNNKNTASVNNV